MNPPLVSQGPSQDMIFIMLIITKCLTQIPEGEKKNLDPPGKIHPLFSCLALLSIIQIVCSPCFLTEQGKVFISTYILTSSESPLICKFT